MTPQDVAENVVAFNTHLANKGFEFEGSPFACCTDNEAFETVLHEMAHAITLGALVEDHDPANDALFPHTVADAIAELGTTADKDMNEIETLALVDLILEQTRLLNKKKRWFVVRDGVLKTGFPKKVGYKLFREARVDPRMQDFVKEAYSIMEKWPRKDTHV